MYCTNCGAPLKEGEILCSLCNYSFCQSQDNQYILEDENNNLNQYYGIIYNKPGNNKKIAMILSLVVPGLGHMYLNQRVKGFLIFIIVILLSLLTVGKAAVILVPLNVVDTLRISFKINKGL